MKAAFLVAAQRFELRDIPDPPCPDDGLVLRVEACGICGSDIRRWKEGPPPEGEVVPGHEVAGVVVAAGPKASGYSVGARLAVGPDVHCGVCHYCRRGLYNLCDDLRFLGITPGYYGGFAEKMVLTGEVLANGIVHPMPEGLSFIEGALAEPCSSILAAHHKAGTSLDDTVVVMGAGPIGCLHAVVAKARGARVIVSEPDRGRRESARQFQPDAVLDPFSEDIVARVRELTGGLGADVVICANPVAATQTQAVDLVRKGGRVVLFGGLPRASPMATLNSNRIHYGEIEVVGAFSYHPCFHELALDLLRRKVIGMAVVTHRFPLHDIGHAFETAAGGGNALKVMITP